MSSDEKTTDSLIQQIGRLNAEAARRRVKTRSIRDERDTVLRDLQDLKTKLEDAGRERDLFRQRLEAEPSELHNDNERLRNELRARDHKDAFSKVAVEAKVRPEAIDDLWKLSGFAPDTDLPDLQQLQELVEGAKSARPYLFQSEPAAAGKTESPTQTQARPPGPGLSRGVPDTTSGGVAVRQAQLRDPNWMRFNQGAIAEASKKGILTILPD